MERDRNRSIYGAKRGHDHVNRKAATAVREIASRLFLASRGLDFSGSILYSATNENDEINIFVCVSLLRGARIGGGWKLSS